MKSILESLSSPQNWLVLAVYVLAGCAAPVPVSKEEITIAKGKYMMCLVPYAGRFDDGISDARTVASAMVGACPSEYNVLFDTLTRNDNAGVKRMLHEKRTGIQTDIALNVVLNLRARARTK